MCLCVCAPSVHDSLLNPLLSGGKKKSESESIVYENFSLTVSLFGVISGVYCECRLMCHCVWRCVTVLEYILVRCESVCGCINVCRAPPASLQAELANGRIRAAESSCKEDGSSRAAPGTRAAPLSPDWQAAAEPCSCMHVCHSCSVQSDTQITTVKEGRKNGIIIDDGVGEQRCGGG